MAGNVKSFDIPSKFSGSTEAYRVNGNKVLEVTTVIIIIFVVLSLVETNSKWKHSSSDAG